MTESAPAGIVLAATDRNNAPTPPTGDVDMDCLSAVMLTLVFNGITRESLCPIAYYPMRNRS